MNQEKDTFIICLILDNSKTFQEINQKFSFFTWVLENATGTYKLL